MKARLSSIRGRVRIMAGTAAVAFAILLLLTPRDTGADSGKRADFKISDASAAVSYAEDRQSRDVSEGAASVQVQMGDAVVRLNTNEESVQGFLGSKEILLGPLDTVKPALSSKILDGMSIEILRVDRALSTVERELPAATVWRGDGSVPLDTPLGYREGRAGRGGERTRQTEIEGDRQAIDSRESWVISPAENHAIVFGKRITKRYLQTEDGQSLAYWRRTRMLVTSYSAARSGTPRDAAWYGLTYSGAPMGAGVLAAHLDYVPLRTRIYVPGYGIGQVLDTGGGLAPMHLDLGYEDDEFVSWREVTDVYWLWPPPENEEEIVWVLPSHP